MGKVFDNITILSSDETASHGAMTWVELPANAESLQISVDQSGTANTVSVWQSPDQVSELRLFSTIDVSSTLHVMTSIPRFLAADTSATVESQMTVVAHFVKPT